jgi:hypothetical protein
MTEQRRPGRPRTKWRDCARPNRYGETIRTQVDRLKADCVFGALVTKFMAEHGIGHASEADEPMKKRFPKYFRGAQIRVTVLRHFAVVYDEPELVEILEAFHDRPDWRTAREGEALIRYLLSS